MARRPRTILSPVAAFLQATDRAYRWKQIPIGNTGGVLAFEMPLRANRPVWDNAPSWSAAPSSRLRSNTMTFGGKTYRFIQFNGGRWEVYRCDPDGHEMFLGYSEDVLRYVLTGAYCKLEPHERETLRRGGSISRIEVV